MGRTREEGKLSESMARPMISKFSYDVVNKFPIKKASEIDQEDNIVLAISIWANKLEAFPATTSLKVWKLVLDQSKLETQLSVVFKFGLPALFD